MDGLVGECVSEWMGGWKSREIQKKYNSYYTLGRLPHLENEVGQFSNL